MKKITPLAKALADRIRSKREALGYSQESFAEKVGVSIGTVKTVETLVHSPSIDTLVKLSGFLDITLDELVHGSSKDENFKSTTDKQPIIDISSLTFSGRVLSSLAGLKPFHRDFVLALTLKDFSFLEKYEDADIDEVFQEILKYS